MSDELKQAVARLKERVGTLESCFAQARIDVKAIVAQRGLKYASDSRYDRVILPEPSTDVPLEDYLRYLKRYSFRLLLRDVIKNRKRFGRDDLLHYCSPAKTERYLQFLLKAGMIFPVKGDEYFALHNTSAFSFGDTLEWYVAQIFAIEFASLAAWDVQVYDLPRGGDFDVIALCGQTVVYVETKSSPPKNIHQQVVGTFLDRVEALAPDVAIFLVDTHLRLEDKINKMVRWELRERHPKKKVIRLNRLRRGIFAGPGALFIINSKPDLSLNLRICLRSYWSRQARCRLFGEA